MTTSKLARQIDVRDVKTPSSGSSGSTSADVDNIAGGGHGLLVVPGGADDVVPGGFPITLRVHFGDLQEEIPMPAPRALFFPRPFTRVDLVAADADRGYTVHVAIDPGVAIGPARSTRRAVNVWPAGTPVPSAPPETMADGFATNSSVGALIGRFDGGDETTVIAEYIRYADGSWELTGNTYTSGDSFTIAVDHPGAAYWWRHTGGADPTWLLDVVAEIG